VTTKFELHFFETIIQAEVRFFHRRGLLFESLFFHLEIVIEAERRSPIRTRDLKIIIVVVVLVALAALVTNFSAENSIESSHAEAI